MKRITSLLAVMAVALTTAVMDAAHQGRDTRAETALQAAIKVETIDGKPEAAIVAYKDIVQKYPTNRQVVAQALSRMAGCYEKQGTTQIDEARKTYERLTREFGDQTEVATRARTRLAALPVASAAGSSHARLRLAVDAPTGSGMGAEVSRDGRYFGYWVRGTVRIRDLATNNEREMTPVDLTQVLGFSPDFSSIAYIARTASNAELRVLPTDGGSARSLGSPDGMFQWSADSREIHRYMPKGTMVIGRTAIPVLGGSARPLPDWTIDPDLIDYIGPQSPDGRSFVYVRHMKESAGQTALVSFDLSTGRETQLTAGDAVDKGPMWASDSTRVAFIRTEGGERALWSVPISTGKPVTATVHQRLPANATGPFGLSADGSFHYLTSEDAHRRYVVGVKAGNHVSESSLAELPVACGGYGYGWASARSMAIVDALDGPRTGGPCPGDRILIRSIAGEADRTLSPGIQGMSRPRQSPDGTRLLVTGHQGATWGIFGIDLKSGAASLLVKMAEWVPRDEAMPAADWSPDGRGLIIARRTETRPFVYQVVYRDLATGQETIRYSHDRGLFWPSQMSVGPDGSAHVFGNLFVAGEAVVRASMLVPADGGPMRPVYQGKEPYMFSSAHVSGDGKGVWVSQRKATTENLNGRELLWVPVDGGPPVSSGLLMAGLDGIVASPDGTMLMLYRNSLTKQLWTIDKVLGK